MVDKCQLRVEEGSPQKVKLADSSELLIKGIVQLNIELDGLEYPSQAMLLQMPHHDLILGIEWLQQHQATLDFESNIISFWFKDGSIKQALMGKQSDCVLHLDAIKGTGLASDLLGHKEMNLIIRKEGHCFLLVVWEELDLDGHWAQISDSKIKQILEKHRNVFQSDIPQDERIESIPMLQQLQDSIICTGEEGPKNIWAYNLAASQLQEQEKQVQALLNCGIIQESSSPWGFPVIFVPKKDGGWHMCINYQALNAITSTNGYPLPIIQQCLDQLGQARCFLKINLTSGYWQIRLKQDNVLKTAFNTQIGKFEFLVMPFGLKNAPLVFQTLVNQVLRPYLDKFVIVYLDDILIYSKTLEEHREHVQKILEILEQHWLFAKPLKCTFGATSIEFCGHLVGQGTIKPLEDKVKLIWEWPRPSSIHDLRSFLGLCLYYWRYAKGFASITAPLFDLLKVEKGSGLDIALKNSKNVWVIWNDQADLAFRKIKDLLCSEPILRQPDLGSKYTIETDASDWAIGCVLLQVCYKRIDPQARCTQLPLMAGRCLKQSSNIQYMRRSC